LFNDDRLIVTRICGAVAIHWAIMAPWSTRSGLLFFIMCNAGFRVRGEFYNISARDIATQLVSVDA
jgi:hypothetical protein